MTEDLSKYRLIRASDVRDLLGGVSDMYLWRRLHDDETFPKPIYIRKRRFWREADVLAWQVALEESAN